MTEQEIKDIVTKQRKYFYTGATLPVSTRLAALQKLYNAISGHEAEIHDALKKDLGKSGFESYMCETGLVLEEISYMMKHTKRFAGEKRVRTPLAQFHSRSYKKPSPYGVTLIMSPWNYPFMLTLSPLVDALAAGNTAVVKPSAYSPHTSEVIRHILSECFEPQYVAVVTGGRAENTCLLHEHFDYIFFTGSQAVGKEVMRNAAEYLTPVTLELGGKSPCIVDQTADIKLAARRIVFGKYLNCGQTCVAPDYVYCHRSIKDKLIKEVKKQIQKQYGKQPLHNPNYGKIINEKHFDRITGLIDEKKVVHGGNSERKTLRIEPTVMDNVTFSDAVMQEEIFGPILPVIEYENLEQAISYINANSKPLALYVFSENNAAIETILQKTASGGVSINDTISHIINPHLPFGGIGLSGMGNYHGEYSFRTFSHQRSILRKSSKMRLSLVYPPFTERKLKTVKTALK